MELKDQIIQEYLLTGCGYRKLQAKYGISRTTICKWVQVYQGIHNFLPPWVRQLPSLGLLPATASESIQDFTQSKYFQNNNTRKSFHKKNDFHHFLPP